MPIITTVAVTSFLTSLAQKGLDKAFETGGEKISEGAYNWIKSLFFKDNEPKKILKELQENPQNVENISNATAIVNNSLEDNPQFEIFLKEIIEKLPKIENTISNSKNVNTGNINTKGGDFRIGDNYGN
jgi:organic radical activating enzyme